MQFKPEIISKLVQQCQLLTHIIQQFEILMTCKQKIKDLFLKCDVFATSEFLRYDSEPEYRTLTGAFCSIVTIVAFFAIFTNVIVGTFNRNEIIWSLNTVQEQVDSFELDTQVQGQNKFMFGISISGIDLNSGLQYFDVKVTLKTRNNSVQQNFMPVKLQPCTPDHWNVNDQILQTYYRMGFYKMLCPPIGQKIPLQGKFSSKMFTYAEIQILKCTNISKTCVNDADLQNRTFLMNVYFINSLINPQLPEYVTYYLQDRNYVQFTTSYTSLLNIFISKFKITTDESILPYQSIKQQIGCIVNNLAQNVPRQEAEGKVFANAVLRRASTSVIVTRGFKKVDETLSYIGGLFGFVMIALLIMKQYTEYSFQIDASSHLYHQDKQNPINSDKFNFLVFIGYLFYLFLGIFGLEPNWKIMKTYDDSREQIQKQFDVRFLFQRLNFIQKSLHLLFNENETKFIHLNRKPTLKQASELRQNYNLKEMFKQNNLQITQSHINNNDNLNLQGSNSIISNKNKITTLNALQNPLNKIAHSSKMKKGLKMLRKKTLNGDQISKKIIEDLDPQIIKIIHQANIQGEDKSQQQSNSIEKLQTSNRPRIKKTQSITQTLQFQIQPQPNLKRPNLDEVGFTNKTQKDNKVEQMDFQFMN